MLAGEFRRQAAARGVFGFDDERYRKITRALQRNPEIVAEGFSPIAEDPSVRGRGGVEIAAVDVAFLVFAALAGGAINEELGRHCGRLYTASHPSLLDGGPVARCPITRRNRAGDVLRDILASPHLAARVEDISLWREAGQVSFRWKGGPEVLFGHADKLTASETVHGPMTTCTMRGERLLWLAEAIGGLHTAPQRKGN